MRKSHSVIANQSADWCGNLLRKITTLFVLTAMLLSLTACHGKQEAKVFEIPAEFDTSRNYEISFWAKNDTNKTQVAIYEKAIADFQKLYPNITVNLRLYTDYGRIYNDVITNIATDTTPNVCITYHRISTRQIGGAPGRSVHPCQVWPGRQ